MPNETVSETNGRKITLTGIGVLLNLLVMGLYVPMSWQKFTDMQIAQDGRITKLELVRSDSLADSVTQLTRQVDKLWQIVQTDHDALMTNTNDLRHLMQEKRL